MLNLTKTLINYESAKTLLWMMGEEGFRDIKLTRVINDSVIYDAINFKNRCQYILERLEENKGNLSETLTNKLMDIGMFVNSARFLLDNLTQDWFIKFTVVTDTEISGVAYNVGDEFWLVKDELADVLDETEHLIKSIEDYIRSLYV